ncbi:DedA family protein [Pseudomonadales bacterium]|nr:DedA family protein [Pseudomonadales bacterium]
MLRNLYDWVLTWADHRYASFALFVMAFAEASFFPIPPDVLLLAMAMGAPNKALRFAAICTLGSVLGGITGYAMGWGLWGVLDSYFYQYVPGFNEALFIRLAESFSDNTFSAIFAAGFTPIPFKVFTIAAGAALVPFGIFVLGAVASRALRYGLLAALIMWFGPTIKVWTDKYFNILTIVATVLLVGGFVLIGYMH